MTSLTHKTNPHMVVKQIMIMTAQAMTDSGFSGDSRPGYNPYPSTRSSVKAENRAA